MGINQCSERLCKLPEATQLGHAISKTDTTSVQLQFVCSPCIRTLSTLHSFLAEAEFKFLQACIYFFL